MEIAHQDQGVGGRAFADMVAQDGFALGIEGQPEIAVAMLGVLMYISRGLSAYGLERIFQGVIERFREEGMTRMGVISKIQNYPLTADLKRRLIYYIEQNWPDESQGKQAFLTRACRNGHPNAPSSKFCTECGVPLGGDDDAGAVAPSD